MQTNPSPIQPTKERNSNAELLRLICMFFIVVHHFIVHSIYPEVLQGKVSWDSEIDLLIAQFLNAFCFIGVNCFVLISGYFGIKLKWKGIVSLYFTCFLCFLTMHLIDFACSFVFGNTFVFNRAFWSYFLVFTRGYGWYIPCYLCLMFISPLINKAIESFNKKEFTNLLILLTIGEVYFAYYNHEDAFGSAGYTIQHLVYMYLLGAYIQRYGQRLFAPRYRYIWLGLYLFCSIVYGFIPMLNIRILHWQTFAYTNPILILSSVSFFYFIVSFQFQSTFINHIAKSAIAVYLIHEALGFKGLFYFLSSVSADFPEWMKLLWLLGMAVGCFVGIIVLDQVRRLIQPYLEKVVMWMSTWGIIQSKKLFLFFGNHEKS